MDFVGIYKAGIILPSFSWRVQIQPVGGILPRSSRFLPFPMFLSPLFRLRQHGFSVGATTLGHGKNGAKEKGLRHVLSCSMEQS